MKTIQMNLPFLTLTVILLSLVFSNNVLAETRYVSDELVISVRSGPGKEFKIIKTINTGTPMEVLENQGDFIKVKTEKDLIGWVPKFYTVVQTPKSVIIDQLNAKLERVTSKVEDLATQKGSMAENLKKINKTKSLNQQTIDNLSQELLELKKKHETILADTNNILKTTQERDRLKQDSFKMNQKIQILEDKNNSLSDKKMIFWFLAGAGTFLLGWLIGKISRRNRKRTLSI